MSTAVLTREPLLRRPEVRFPVRFAVVSVVLAVGWSVLQPTSAWLRDATATVVVWISNLVGLDAATEAGAYVRFGHGDHVFRYVVADGCTATLVMATYAAAVIAYPAGRRDRLLGVVVGVPVLLVVNLARLVSLGWVGLHAHDAFDAVHLYWWQVFYVAGTGALWFAWAWWASGARTFLLERRRAPRHSAVTTALVVGLQLTIFAVIGLWGHGAELYLRALQIPQSALNHVLWSGNLVTGRVTDHDTFATFAGYYALLAGVLALFLASPGIDLRKRVRGALCRGLPLTVAMQLAFSTWTTTAQVRSAAQGGDGPWQQFTAFLHPFMPAMHMGLSLVVWQLWLQRARHKEEERQVRAAARRRSAGKGRR